MSRTLPLLAIVIVIAAPLLLCAHQAPSTTKPDAVIEWTFGAGAGLRFRVGVPVTPVPGVGDGHDDGYLMLVRDGVVTSIQQVMGGHPNNTPLARIAKELLDAGAYSWVKVTRHDADGVDVGISLRAASTP